MFYAFYSRLLALSPLLLLPPELCRDLLFVRPAVCDAPRWVPFITVGVRRGVVVPGRGGRAGVAAAVLPVRAARAATCRSPVVVSVMRRGLVGVVRPDDDPLLLAMESGAATRKAGDDEVRDMPVEVVLAADDDVGAA